MMSVLSPGFHVTTEAKARQVQLEDTIMRPLEDICDAALCVSLLC